MSMSKTRSQSVSSLLLWSLILALTAGCGDAGTTQGRNAPTPSPGSTAEASSQDAATDSAVDRWWARLERLCGQAFEGKVVSTDETDAALRDQTLTLYVRRCAPDKIEVPFHVGDDRSRTWVLTRRGDTVHLQHDHRHEDGSEDTVTLYGGLSADDSSDERLNFPADEYSKTLFENNGLAPSVSNVWSMELIEGERFSYVLKRPGRHFRADFDLGRAVDPPPEVGVSTPQSPS